MGICSSTSSTQVATAKLILPDGKLQEYSYPVRVSYVLQKHPACFICNADEMDFDDVVSAVNDNDELHPGQLYFALPTSWLKHPLQAEEMAALAVRASSALMKSGGRKNSVSPVTFSGEEVKPGRTTGGARRGRKSSAMLSAIPE
ncbi:hypothetical protein ABKV19_007261 [Rosa sericea]